MPKFLKISRKQIITLNPCQVIDSSRIDMNLSIIDLFPKSKRMRENSEMSQGQKAHMMVNEF
jgi:hypothetical protein